MFLHSLHLKSSISELCVYVFRYVWESLKTYTMETCVGWFIVIVRSEFSSSLGREHSNHTFVNAENVCSVGTKIVH